MKKFLLALLMAMAGSSTQAMLLDSVVENSIPGVMNFASTISEGYAEIAIPVALTLGIFYGAKYWIRNSIHGIMSAIRTHDNKELEFLLRRGVSSNARTGTLRQNLFHIAAINNNSEAIELLIKYSDANVNMQDRLGLTPLHYLVKGGSIKGLHTLLAYKVDINKQDVHGHTPLYCAAGLQNVDMVTALIQAGAKEDIMAVDQTLAKDLVPEKNLRLFLLNGSKDKICSQSKDPSVFKRLMLREAYGNKRSNNTY